MIATGLAPHAGIQAAEFERSPLIESGEAAELAAILPNPVRRSARIPSVLVRRLGRG